MRRRNGEDKSDPKRNGSKTGGATDPSEAVRRAFVEVGLEAGEPCPVPRDTESDEPVRDALGAGISDVGPLEAQAGWSLR